MLPGRPERTVDQAVRIYPAFTEHTYRIVFPFEEHFAPKAPHLLTIVPSGTVENDKVLEPKKEKGLITFAYPQTISDEAAELPVPQPQDGSADGNSAMDGKGRKLCETPFVWCREDGTNALVQTWPTNLNEKFRQDFEIFGGANPDSAKFLPQAVAEFQEAMVKLFGPAANICPVWFCHKKLSSTSPAVVGFSEDVLAHVNEHPELMRELSIASVDTEGLGFMADGTNGKGEKFEKHFRLTPGEKCVLYRKMGWDTMGCIKPLHQFLGDAELHEPPAVELHESPTLEETTGMDEKPAATLVEAPEELKKEEEEEVAKIKEDFERLREHLAERERENQPRVSAVHCCEGDAVSSNTTEVDPVTLAEVTTASCFESDANSSKATEVGPASGWLKFSDPDTSRDWFWNGDTEEWFFTHDSGLWNKFLDDLQRAWWWHEQTGAWFYEPEDGS